MLYSFSMRSLVSCSFSLVILSGLESIFCFVIVTGKSATILLFFFRAFFIVESFVSLMWYFDVLALEVTLSTIMSVDVLLYSVPLITSASLRFFASCSAKIMSATTSSPCSIFDKFICLIPVLKSVL